MESSVIFGNPSYFWGNLHMNVILRDYLVGLVVASVTAEQDVLGSNPGSGKVLWGFFIKHFSVTVTEPGFFPVDDNRVAPYYMRVKNKRNEKKTNEMWVNY